VADMSMLLNLTAPNNSSSCSKELPCLMLAMAQASRAPLC
jgi:hypothetical protein